MKTEKTRCSLCAMLATLSAITSVTTLFFLYTTSLNQGPSRTKTIMRHSHAFEPLLKSAAIGVLLQQSQVQVHEQPTRLRTIDSSWASWLHTKGSELPIKVYAAVPKEWHANEDFRLHHLHTVSMLADSSPYHNMINSLFRVISDSTVGNLKWLVMANDHSFIVPPNLRKFLQGLDADVLAYSGNELKMVYKKRILSFASGGAGAVMSHTVVKLMLAVWVATGWDDSIFAFQNGSTSAGPSSIGEMGSCSPDSILLDMRDTGAVISMGLAFLHQWMLGLASEQALKALQRSVCGDGHDADRFRRQVSCKIFVFSLTMMQVLTFFLLV